MLMMKAKAVHVCVFFVTSVIYRHTTTYTLHTRISVNRRVIFLKPHWQIEIKRM